MSRISVNGGVTTPAPDQTDVVTRAPVGILKDIVIERTGANAVANGHLLQYNADATPEPQWENSNVIDGGTY